MRPIDMLYLIVISIVIVLYIGYKLFIRKRWKVALSKVNIKRLKMVSSKADLVGYKGGDQLSGNGYLLLTDKCVHYEQIWPRKNATICFKQPFEVKVIHRWHTVAVGKPLLHIVTNDEEFVWNIESPYEWLKHIKQDDMRNA